MKLNCLILIAITIVSFCLFQSGCEEQTMATEGHEPKLTATEPATSPAETEAADESAKGGPVIMFEKVVHDFCDIGPGSTNICEFKFTNTGNSLLEITDVSKTCGCTPYTLEKKEYEPGESGTLKVEFHAGRQAGPTHKTLFVSSNDKSKPRVELVVKGKIVQKVTHEPEKLDLALNRENAGCPAIKIKSLDNQPFSVKGFRVIGRPKSAEKAITADYNAMEKATEFVLHLKADVNALREVSGGSIEITLTHPESGVINIPFEVLPRFKVTPPSIIVYKAELEQSVKREVWILNNYEEDFEIESTSSQEGAIKVLSQEKVDNRYRLELEITPPAAEKGRKGFFTDMFFVNIKSGEQLKVPCRMFYVKK
ncbi:MAG: DUF1573 domain-containing protein [Sedimentisphaerales bacterium]|nr:DUF1573 domain-containing protein [Sedimentisphaerales bacterium]